MWSYLTTGSFLNPLPGYVEGKAGNPKNGLRSTNWFYCRGVSISCRPLRLDVFERTQLTHGQLECRKRYPAIKGLAIVPGSGDAAEAFSRAAAPTRLL
jgi:hypothetical protein